MDDRWQEIKTHWLKEPLKDLGVFIPYTIDSIPQLICLATGTMELYTLSEEIFGRESVFAPHNLLRAFCHFIGGRIIAYSFLPLHWLWSPTWYIVSAEVLTAFAWKELYLDPKNEQRPRSPKDFTDVIAWTVGSVIWRVI